MKQQQTKRFAVTIVRTITTVIYVEEESITTVADARRQIEDYGIGPASRDYTNYDLSDVEVIKSVKAVK